MVRSPLFHTQKNVHPLVLFRDVRVDHWSSSRFQFRKISSAVDLLRDMDWRSCKPGKFEESPKICSQPWLNFLVERGAGLDAFDRLCIGEKHGIKYSPHCLGPHHHCHFRIPGAFSITSASEKNKQGRAIPVNKFRPALKSASKTHALQYLEPKTFLEIPN